MVKSKHIVLGIAIALISVFFFVYAIQTVYPAPEYGDYCDERIKPVLLPKDEVITQEICEENDGEWTAQNIRCVTTPCPEGYCDYYSKCQGEYNTVRESYERTVFFANLIIGIVVLIGAFFLAVEAVSTGLMGGAVMLIVYATIRYWGNLSDVWRTVVLGLSLVLLIGLAYKKLK